MKKPFDFLKKKTSQTNSESNNFANQGQPSNYNNNQWQQGGFSPNQWRQGGYYPNQWPQPNQKPLVPCVCPRCGANLMIDDGIDTFYCQYCGCKIMLQNETNLKTRFGVKKLEHTEKMADKVIGFFDRRSQQKAIEEEKKRKDSNIAAIISILFFVLVLIGCIFGLNSSKRESQQQEIRLQQILDDAQTDISNGDYDLALIKASQLTYTSGYSNSVKEKWDGIREQMISLITELQTGKTDVESSIVPEQENSPDEHIEITNVEPIITPDYTSTPEKIIENIVYSPNNDRSTLYPNDERVLSFLIYPKGITENDFGLSIYGSGKISDIHLEDNGDATEVFFKVTADSSIKHSSDRSQVIITITPKKGRAKSRRIEIDALGLDILDAEPLTLKVNEPQIAIFKVYPASLPLEDLKIGMNAYVGNLKAEIIGSTPDEDNKFQYVQVRITANGKHNGYSKGYVNLNDKNQWRGGTCNLTIVD